MIFLEKFQNGGSRTIQNFGIRKKHIFGKKNLKISCSGCRSETDVIVRNVIHIDATMTCTISSTPKLLIINTSNLNQILNLISAHWASSTVQCLFITR